VGFKIESILVDCPLPIWPDTRKALRNDFLSDMAGDPKYQALTVGNHRTDELPNSSYGDGIAWFF
jgi:hypothetical protein